MSADCVDMRTLACICACVYMHIGTDVHSYLQAARHIRVQTHTHTHTNTHTHNKHNVTHTHTLIHIALSRSQHHR